VQSCGGNTSFNTCVHLFGYCHLSDFVCKSKKRHTYDWDFIVATYFRSSKIDFTDAGGAKNMLADMLHSATAGSFSDPRERPLALGKALAVKQRLQNIRTTVRRHYQDEFIPYPRH